MIEYTPVMPAITMQEMADQLRRVIRGEVRIACDDGAWLDNWGDVRFSFDGWGVTFFNDAGGLDYVDSANSPDGRVTDYDEWARESDGSADPLWLLTESERSALEVALRQAKPTS